MNEIFQLRPEQQTVINQIISEFENNEIQNIILDAPTGSGKSIIAMYLSNYFFSKQGKKGYILTSNLALQDQYNEDFKKFNQINFVSLKGNDNYLCDVTNTSVKNGYCNTHKITGVARKNLDCYASCRYYNIRELAIKSPVALLNYSYWLTQKNYVGIRHNLFPFRKRDFIIFDEAHNVDMILHNHFLSFIDGDIDKRLQSLYLIFRKYGLSFQEQYHIKDYNMLRRYQTQAEHVKKLNYLYDSFTEIREHCNSIKTIYRLNANHKKPQLSDEIKREVEVINYFLDMLCKMEDFLDFIVDQNKLNNIVVTKNPESIHYSSVDTKKYFSLFLNRHCPPIRLFMSATWGNNYDLVMQSYSLDPKKTKVLHVDPKWDYERSPIFFIKNAGEMNWKNKERSIQGNTKIVEKIINHHRDENGLIHTVNYEVMNYLKNNLKNKRLLFYNNSKEKELVLQKFYESGGILVGPSHFEGLNFTDEQSRFQIIMKVPYLTLGDTFIMEKSKLNPMWYSWKTYVSMVQGIGRSIRHRDDYAVTYIVDGSFNRFLDLNSNFFSQNITQRLQIV